MKNRNWKIAIGCLFGAVLGSLIALVRDLPVKQWVPLLSTAVFALLVALSRQRERFSQFAFLLTVPFPMHAFLLKFDPLHGGGALGIYLMAADLPLIVLYLLWLFDWTRRRTTESPRASRLILWMFPFLIVGGLSVIYSIRPLWAACEWLRWAKVALVLIYATKRLRLRDVTWCLSALAVSVLLQSSLAVLQSVTQSKLGLDRLGIFGAGGEEDLTQELLGGQILHRGSGMTGHPNFIASYLLIALPIFALLSLVEQRKSFRILWSAAFGVGLGGLVSTMSRAAWASFLTAGIVAFVIATFLSIIHFKKAVVISLGGLLVAGLLVLPLYPLIVKRFETDFSASWNLRVQLNETALAIAHDHPIGGVGLNNYTIVYPEYDPSFANEMMERDDMITVVHNVYLLILAEVGAIGLTAFLSFYIAVFVCGARSLLSTKRWSQAVSLGILCGIFGAMLFDLTEVSLWVEITMYTIAFLVGMLEALAHDRVTGEVFCVAT